MRDGVLFPITVFVNILLFDFSGMLLLIGHDFAFSVSSVFQMALTAFERCLEAISEIWFTHQIINAIRQKVLYICKYRLYLATNRR